MYEVEVKSCLKYNYSSKVYTKYLLKKGNEVFAFCYMTPLENNPIEDLHSKREIFTETLLYVHMNHTFQDQSNSFRVSITHEFSIVLSKSSNGCHFGPVIKFPNLFPNIKHKNLEKMQFVSFLSVYITHTWMSH